MVGAVVGPATVGSVVDSGVGVLSLASIVLVTGLVTGLGAGPVSAACSLSVDEQPPSMMTAAITAVARRPFILPTVEPGRPAGR